MARPMTPAEQQRFRAYFPNLNVTAAVVTDNPTAAYNCIAWTVGITTRWLWPGNTLANFDTFYGGFGYVRATDGPVAAWGVTALDMKHGCVSGPGHGPRWESKCGTDLRIQHGLNELAGSSYGNVLAFYRRDRSLDAPFEQLVEEVMSEKTSRSYLTAAQRKALSAEVAAVPSETRDAFRGAFAAWKATWDRGGLAFNSNPQARSVGEEFDALIALGPAIIPLVVEALADPDNFFALQLYNAIQPNDRLRIQFGPDDERILEGEQGRARLTVQAWFTNR